MEGQKGTRKINDKNKVLKMRNTSFSVQFRRVLSTSTYSVWRSVERERKFCITGREAVTRGLTLSGRTLTVPFQIPAGKWRTLTYVISRFPSILQVNISTVAIVNHAMTSSFHALSDSLFITSPSLQQIKCPLNTPTAHRVHTMHTVSMTTHEVMFCNRERDGTTNRGCLPYPKHRSPKPALEWLHNQQDVLTKVLQISHQKFLYGNQA
jgi:hypothetical protein